MGLRRPTDPTSYALQLDQTQATKAKKDQDFQDQLRKKLLEDQALIKKTSQEAGQEFQDLAKQQLGSLEQFRGSDRAQEQLARQQAMAASQGAQRALAGRLAAQGVRGGAAVNAQLGAANQAAMLQSQIGQQMLAQRADREQQMREQLLSAMLAGRQVGSTQMQTLLANQANLEATRLARK